MLEQETGSAFDWLHFSEDLTLDKDEVRDVAGMDGWATEIDRMLRDGQCASIYMALTFPLRQANLTLVRPEDDEGQTEFCREVLWNPPESGGMETPITTIIGQQVHSIAVRKTYHEKVFTRRDDGKISYKKIAHRPTASCELVRGRRHGEWRGLRQYMESDAQGPETDSEGFVTIPMNRSVIHIHGQHRDPLYGHSDLTAVHWAYLMKQKVLKLWFTFLGGQSLPKVIAYGHSETQAKANARSIASLRGSGVVGVERTSPDEKIFDVLETHSTSVVGLYKEALMYIDSQMSSSVLAGWIDLPSWATSGGRGSYALSADQSQMFMASRFAAAREISATWASQIIKDLCWLNWGPGTALPKLKFEKINESQADRIMRLLEQLGSAPSLQVPPEFIDMLIEQVSAYLDLPDDRVEKMIRRAAQDWRVREVTAPRLLPPTGSPAGHLTDIVMGASALVDRNNPGGGPKTVPAADIPRVGAD